MHYFYESHCDIYSSERRNFSELDHNGFFKPVYNNVADISELEWEIIDYILETNRMIPNVISIYFRDTVEIPKNKIRFDFIVVVKGYEEGLKKKITLLLNMGIRSSFFFLYTFNPTLISLIDLTRSRYLQFLIKNLSYRVFGPSLEKHFQEFNQTPDFHHSIKLIDKKLKDIERIYNNSDSTLPAACRHLIKHLIRASFEVVSTNFDFYTRTPALCLECFDKCLPQYKQMATRIFDYYSNEVVNYNQFFKDVKVFVDLLKSEYQSKFIYKKPEQHA